MINKNRQSAVRDTRAYRGADVNSDHYLVIARIKIKLSKNIDKSKSKPRLNMQWLKDIEIKSQFALEVRNRFAVLEETGDIEKYNKNVEDIYVGASEKVLGYTKKRARNG